MIFDRDVHMAAKVAALDDPPQVCSLQLTKQKWSDWARSYRRPQPRHTDRCQATTAAGCRNSGKRAQHTANRSTGEGARDSRLPTPAHRTNSQWVAGHRPHAPGTGSRASESAQPRTPQLQARGTPPRAPSCRPHSAQSQLARLHAVGLVTGSHAPTPRTHSQLVAGPGRTLQKQAVGRGRALKPGRATRRQQAPPRVPSCCPHSAKPARKSAHGGVCDGFPRPHTAARRASG